MNLNEQEVFRRADEVIAAKIKDRVDSMLADLSPLLAEFYDGNIPALPDLLVDAVRYRFLRSRSGSEWSESAGGHEKLDAEIDTLINAGERPEPKYIPLCNHPGYPFGEPPIMSCVLPLGHDGDHESDYQGQRYKHSEIWANRKAIGI